MNKQVIYNTQGHRADIGPIEIYRLVSNNFISHVGHFVFLDYIPPFMLSQKKIEPNAAHPHRGIATLTYILSGAFEHFDSMGNRGTIYSGGLQWMKAGNGIVHNEAPGPDPNTGGKLMHGFQFWINLPAAEKRKKPEYVALQSDELPLINLGDTVGTLKVLVGRYKDISSKIPTYANQILYHIHLHANTKFTLSTTYEYEYAVFLPQQDLIINGTKYFHRDLIGFDDKGGEIEFINDSSAIADFIFFGGEKYSEPYVAQGPFVMNTQAEIYEAYADAQRGTYGKINYN